MQSRNKKALATAGAVAALGALGGFGTFAAFTDQLPAQQTQFKTGTVKVTGGFNMPDASSLGTQEPARAGSMTIKNTGTEPVNAFVDWDGPVGNIKCDGVCDRNTNKTAFSDDPLAENIIVDSSYDADFAHLLDDNTRLWKLNDRNLFPLLDGGLNKLVLQPGQERTLYFRVRLREQGPNAWGQNADDNVMQGKAANETINVKAIEAGTSYRGLGDVTAGSDGLPQGWTDTADPYDNRPDNHDSGQ